MRTHDQRDLAMYVGRGGPKIDAFVSNLRPQNGNVFGSQIWAVFWPLNSYLKRERKNAAQNLERFWFQKRGRIPAPEFRFWCPRVCNFWVN